MRTKKTEIPQDEVLQTARRFDLLDCSLCFMLYHVRNDRLIEYTTMTNVVCWLNLRDPDPPIIVKSKEKTRCCYFFKAVSEHLVNRQFKDEWIRMMLKSVGISESHYKAHTYEVGISNPTADKKLKADINEAIKRAKSFNIQTIH